MANIRTNNHLLILVLSKVQGINDRFGIYVPEGNSTLVEDSRHFAPYLKKRTQFSKSQVQRMLSIERQLRPNGHLVTQDKTNPNEPNFLTTQTAKFTQFHINELRTMNHELIKFEPRQTQFQRHIYKLNQQMNLLLNKSTASFLAVYNKNSEPKRRNIVRHKAPRMIKSLKKHRKTQIFLDKYLSKKNLTFFQKYTCKNIANST